MESSSKVDTKILRNIRYSCISGLASIILTPLLVLIAIIIVTIRGILSTYLWIVYRGKVNLISSMDSFQVFDKPNNILETYTFLILEGEADITKIRISFQDKVINNTEDLYEKLKCVVVKQCGFYCWENIGTNFDIKRHVNLIGNGLDSNKIWMEEEVLTHLSTMYSSPISIEVPRWELVVVPNFVYTSDNANCESASSKYYAVIFRLHHSIMDGISTYLLLSHGLADFPVETAINPLKSTATFPKQFLEYLNVFIMWPKMFYENMVTEAEKNCFHGPDLTGPKIVLWSKPMQMTVVKNIRKISKCSTVAVLNSAVGGAFRQLALDKGLSVPMKLTVVTSIPMLPYPNLKPQNRFSGAFFPIEIESTSRAIRIQSTQNTLKGIVKSGLILMNSLLLRFIGILPGSWSQNMTDSRELTCLTSNIPGPIKPTYFFGGDKLVDVGGWLPIKNKTGFGVCFVTYCGRLRVSIVADNAVTSKTDVSTFLQAFEKEITDMEEEFSNTNVHYQSV